MKKITLIILTFTLLGLSYGEKIKDVRKISITSPKEGEVFFTSGELPIAWKTIGISGKLKIVLRKHDGSDIIKLLGSIPAKGSSSYNHPLGHIAPGQYFVRIRLEGTLIKSDTKVFKIMQPPQQKHVIKTIIVTEPKGDITRNWGLTIAWKASGLSGNVNIMLLKADGSFIELLAYAHPIDKSSFSLGSSAISDWMFMKLIVRIKHIGTGIKRDSVVFEILP